jgi:hypothetical protein
MRAESVSWVNGQASRSYRLTWLLRAIAPGTASVASVHVDLDGGERLHLPGAHADVRAAPPGQPAPEPFNPFDRSFGRRPYREPRVFLRAEAAPAQPWVGERVVYSLWIYTQARIGQMDLREGPQFPGFWAETIPVERDRPGEQAPVDGQPFVRKLLLQRALYPLRPGRLEVSPAELVVLVQSPSADGFAPFLARARRETCRSNPAVVEARALPEPPPGFSGLVGRLALRGRLAPDELRLGEAATLELELAGSGQLAGAAAPAVAPRPGLAVLPPQADFGDAAAPGGPASPVRRWSWALVPERAGSWELPAVEVPYFDPEAGAYRVAAAGPFQLRVAGPAVAPAETAGAPSAAAGLAPPEVAGASRRRISPWLAAAGGLVLVAALLLARRRAAKGAGRRPGGAFASRLERAAAEGSPRQAAAAIEAAWRDHLAERWGVPRDCPASRWPKRLAASGAAAPAAAALAGLVDDLHYLRFAPQLSAVAALRGELVDRSLALARDLR